MKIATLNPNSLKVCLLAIASLFLSNITAQKSGDFKSSFFSVSSIGHEVVEITFNNTLPDTIKVLWNLASVHRSKNYQPNFTVFFIDRGKTIAYKNNPNKILLDNNDKIITIKPNSKYKMSMNLVEVFGDIATKCDTIFCKYSFNPEQALNSKFITGDYISMHIKLR